MSQNSTPSLDMSSLDYESTASASTSTSSVFGNTTSGDNNGTAEAASHTSHSSGNPTVGNAGAQLKKEKEKAIRGQLSIMLHALNCQLRDDLIRKSGSNGDPVGFIYYFMSRFSMF